MDRSYHKHPSQSRHAESTCIHGDGSIDREEFLSIVDKLEDRYCLRLLGSAGFDLPKLGGDFALALLFLVLFFFFVFMGVVGFATTGSFGAVVNSMLPVVGGGGSKQLSSLGGSQSEIDKMVDERVGEHVGTTF